MTDDRPKHLAEENTRGDYADSGSPNHAMSNGLYDTLKFLAQIVFPAFATFYFALADIWGLPKAQEVVGTIVALDAFLGIVLGISNRSYEKSGAKYDGAIEVKQAPDGSKKTFTLALHSDPNDLDSKKQATFKIKPG